MNPSSIHIDSLIPHRRPMRLIDDVLDIGEKTASTRSVVNTDWPLIGAAGAGPVVLIELAAQTAGICIGHRETKAADGGSQGMGWLVGIKSAAFYVEGLPVGTAVVVRTTSRFSFDLFTEITATAFVQDRKVADIVLQVLQSETASQNGTSKKQRTNQSISGDAP